MKIFLSSTFLDLMQIREAAIHFLNGLVGYTKDKTGEIVAMESFAATERTCKEECLTQLSDCNLVIGIYGKRYGTIDPETGLSMTELEFNYAIEHHIPLLAFVQINDDRDAREADFINSKIFGRKICCANFDGTADFLEKLNDSLKEYLGTYDGYSIDSLWSDVSDLHAKILDDIKHNRGVAELQMLPYLADDEDIVLSQLLQTAQYLESIQGDLSAENEAVFHFAYTANHYPENITENDKQELAANVQNCSEEILRNGENITLGLSNHATHLKLLGMYLKLKRMQHRLATEHWSEALRTEVVKTREEYRKIILESQYID